MSNLKEAADEARKLVKMLHSVQVIADVFERISSIENLTAEVEGRLVNAQALEVAELDRRKAIEVEADKILADAETKSVAEIKEKKKAVGVAKLKEESLRKTINGMVSHIEDLKLASEKELADRAEGVRAVDDKIAIKNKELYDIEAKIIQAKETINKMLAG